MMSSSFTATWPASPTNTRLRRRHFQRVLQNLQTGPAHRRAYLGRSSRHSRRNLPDRWRLHHPSRILGVQPPEQVGGGEPRSCPDIEVDDRPDDLVRGKDAQLERAIQEVMKRIEANPKKLPPPPPDLPAYPEGPGMSRVRRAIARASAFMFMVSAEATCTPGPRKACPRGSFRILPSSKAQICRV